MIAASAVAAITLAGAAAGQSAAVGTVVLKEDFSAFGPLLLADIVIEDLPRPEPIDLVIVAGQSNAVGFDAAGTLEVGRRFAEAFLLAETADSRVDP